MKLVIDISEGDYKSACKREFSMDGSMMIYNAIREGTEYKERPHGEWIGDTDLDGTCKCSNCRMTFDIDRLKMVMCDGKYEMPSCCPNCGADMRKEGDSDA